MLRLISFGVCRDTIALLRHVLALAIKGQVRGLAICYWSVTAGHQVALTGIYEAEPERAMAGAEIVKLRAARQLDLFA